MRSVNPQVWWYLARAAGLVAWWTATAAVLWGLMLSGRVVRRRGAPAWLLALHRQLGALTVACTVVHIAALVADNYVDFGWRDILIPFASTWRPAAVAWGVLAMYVLAIVEVTSLFMKRLSRRLWHAVHVWSVAVFLLGTLHALTAGTDRGNPGAPIGALAAIVMFTFLMTYRRLAARTPARPRPTQPSGVAS
jgi:DMSO/TMAO reductase YedYZ heme-binding membrane subunit